MRFFYFLALCCCVSPVFSEIDDIESTWNHGNSELVADYKKAFVKNHYLHAPYSEKPRIPKTIHHIWLGSPLPEKYKKYVESWKKTHPDWKHILWDDKDLESFPLVTGQLLFKSKNLGQRSDIFRLEILNRYGGLYVDTDFLSLRPHDPIHHTCDFYVGMISSDVISNSFIASRSGHPIIKNYLNALKKIDHFLHQPTAILKQTGPYLLTKIINNYLEKTHDGVMIFPSSYFYAFPASARSKFWSNQNLKLVERHTPPHAFGVHLFATSWIKKFAPDCDTSPQPGEGDLQK